MKYDTGYLATNSGLWGFRDEEILCMECVKILSEGRYINSLFYSSVAGQEEPAEQYHPEGNL